MMPLGVSLKNRADQFGDLRIRDGAGAECIGHYGNGLGDADGVGQLDFYFGGQAGGDEIFRDVAGHVAGGAVNFSRVLAGESAATVTAVATVSIDNDLATREAGVAHGAAGDEAAGGINVVLGIFVHHGRGQHWIDYVLAHGVLEIFRVKPCRCAAWR